MGTKSVRKEFAVSALVEAQNLVRKVAEPVPAGDSVKAAIGRASRRLRWNFNRTKSLWYADPRTKVSGDELNELRNAAKQTAGAAGDDLMARLAFIEERLRQIDPDFFGPEIDTLGRVAGRVRGAHTS